MNGIVRKVHGLLLCLALLSIGNNVFASQYSDVIIADNPIAYWKLDQSDGGIAIDEIAGNHATFVGPVYRYSSRVPEDDGQTIFLVGSSSQYIELPDTGLLDQQVFSLELWVEEWTCAPLFVNLPTGAYSERRGIVIREPKRYTSCNKPTIEWGSGGDLQSIHVDNVPSPYTLRHLVVTFSHTPNAPDSENVVRYYLDGVNISETTGILSGISYENASAGSPVEMVRIGGVGGVLYGQESDDRFRGYIDEIAFYDYALTPEQVEQHYFAGRYDITAPRVESVTPSVSSFGMLTRIRVVFNHYDIDYDTFSLEDVSILGPNGEINPTSISNAYVYFSNQQADPGTYQVTIGPDILGMNGLAMDQDQDGIYGEPGDDVYSGTFTIDPPQPIRVFEMVPIVQDGFLVETIILNFWRQLDLTTFTLDDIRLTGPDGALTLTTLEEGYGGDSVVYEVGFVPPLSSGVSYTLEVGPDIFSIDGAGMDQDQDGITGETPDDIFIATFTLDLIPPAPPSVLTYLLAPQINIVSLSPVTVQGSRTEEVSIWINGVESVALGNSAWSLPLNLVEGTNDFILEAEDQAGNRSDPVTLRFAYDTIAPVITGYTPPDDSYTNQPSVTISVNYTETGTGIDQNNSVLTVTRDGSPLAGSWAEEINTLRFIPDQPLLDGVYQLTQQLQDLAGHLSNTVNHGFTLDTLVPDAPTINSLPAVTGSAQITVSGSKEVDSEVLLDGQILVSRNGLSDWSAAVTLANGLNTLSFTVRDRAGNTSAPTAVEITYDDTAPGPVTLLVSNPGDGISLLLDWNSYDEAANGNDIASFAVYIETTPFTSVTALTPSATQTAGNKQYTAQGLVRNQSYYLAVVAIDSQNNRLDNVTPVSATTADNSPPGEVTGLNVVPTATSLQISWNAPADTDGDLAGYRLFFNNDSGTQLDVATTTAERTGLSTASGYPIRITTLDNSGNESAGRSITSATLLPNPTGLSAAGEESRVGLTWNTATPNNLVSQIAIYAETSDFTSVAGLTPRLHLGPSTTAATVTGLTNGTPYYFAVTAINLSNGETPAVTTVSATPQSDQQGPTLGALTFRGSPFTSGATLNESGTLNVVASDLTGMSRIAFQLDGSPLSTDTNGDDGYSTVLDLMNLADGSHTLTLTAYDVLENATTQSYAFTVSLAAPPAPLITSPATGSVTNQTTLNVSGTADAQTEVLLQLNGAQAAGPLALDANHQFQAQVTLAEGSNTLTAQAQNRGGLSPLSSTVSVTLDTQVPDAPLGLNAQSQENGQVLLTWNASVDSRVVSYAVYRAATPFDTIDQAVQANTSPVTENRFTDLPSVDGTFHYRVVALNELDTVSAPSNAASAVADSLMPRALAIRYTPRGEHDPISGRMAAGRVDVEVDVSESLITAPFLSLTPDGGVPISVELTAESDLLYRGYFNIGDLTPSGTAYAVFSARDHVGNRGSEIDQGATILIDTAGPAITALNVTPATPIRNDQLNPVTVNVDFTLDQPVMHGTLPALAYQLSGVGRQSTSIDNLTSTNELNWSGSFQLPADGGLTQAELLSFQLTARDDLNTLGSTIEGENSFQVYQGDLPPLDIPRNLTATAQPAGAVQLQWDAVDDAVAYQLYRQAPGETALTPLQRATTTDFTETVPADGDYLYAVASVRQANAQESVSGQSATVSVTADSQVPARPENLSLALVGAGIQALWDPPTGNSETLSYNIYRASGTVLNDITGLTPIQTDIVANNQAILGYLDTAPDVNASVYAATVVDAAGNESAPSTSAYLNVELLPVATLQVRQIDGGYPTLSWSHNSATITGYNLYLDGSATPVNATPLDGTPYQDLGYSNALRGYTVTALDSNGVESLGRTVELPLLTATLPQDALIRRGVMNRIVYDVVNPGSTPISGVRLQADIEGHNHSSARFDLAAGERRNVEMILGGFDTLPDLAAIETTLEILPESGELVEIVENGQIPVTDSTLSLRIETRELNRGTAGELRFVLENTSEVVTEILTARNNTASPEIRVLLEDGDGNVLSTVPFMQQLGNGVLTLTNGDTVARIQPGEAYTSEWFLLPIPASAPNSVRIQVEIDQFHYQLGQPEQVSIPGMQSGLAVLLSDTAYTADITSIAPASSYGDQPIVIAGQALARDTGLPLAQVPVELVLSVNGFERKIPVATDPAGSFEYSHRPQPGDAGVYTVSAVYPGSLARPGQSSFTLNRVSVSPVNLRLYLAKNYRQTFDMIQAAAGQGTTATNLQLVYDAVDQPTGQFPAGVTLTPAAPINLQSEQHSPLAFTIEGDNSADPVGSLVMRVVSDESGSEPLATINIDYELSEAEPALYFTPNYLETGVAHDDAVTEAITLENRGLADLTDIQVSLLDEYDSPAPAWIYLMSAQNQGNLLIGSTRQIQLAASPTYLVPDGVYPFKLRVESSNYPTTDINIFVAVTQSGVGNVQFKASDIYTATPDENGNPIQGLEGARIRVQHEEIYNLEQIGTTDSYGELLLNDLAAGRYRFRASAPNHQDVLGRLTVKPGITIGQDIFLDFDLITVEWSVTEITIEDRYEITLHATYETDVPAAVIVLEPASTLLPDMAVGDVFQGELRLTNYGLIRADGVQFVPPGEDGYFRYEFLANLPDTLGAKESLVIPYRVTALAPYDPDGTGSGGGCGGYAAGSRVDYWYECKNGQITSGSTRHSWNGKASGDCGTGGSGGGAGGGYGGGGSGGPSGGTYLPELPCIDCKKCRTPCCMKPKLCKPNEVPHGGGPCPVPPRCKPKDHMGGGNGFGGGPGSGSGSGNGFGSGRGMY
ncbi:MAG: fibronectin type III domain-containing protein [Candidatus Thiodiazotropha taylori]|nr:fibronectin type III domain-containing protein [Candidatus Thiodiazotropha taylori]MCW4227062.1 fibronectin type III domain-containing protein [Candidatus Thiodiazotropha endolucinida]MCG7888621.1 fibronectin type III domain-containing protein [Candidatus Thiodiazotropha taylori]MCG7889670.1 fibronectin type III domain-containing protein [Candidatus Thiodiazotropha taylori]MCG8032196.1 fibronectin type III domain-containing protein [Candidatus Thiodiazotropha taylori]